MKLRHFIAEVKRRGIYQVTVYYSTGSWLLLQVADVLVPVFNLPDWTINALLALAALGFPIALVFAWLFDLTAEGLVEAGTVDTPGEKVEWSRTHIIEFTIIVVLAVLVGYLYLDRLTQQQTEETTGQRTSIAVMPFANMTGAADMEYLGDGMAEEILNLLARLNELDVAARTSSFQFKNNEPDIQSIGEQLGVEHVLEGSVRQDGDRVRVTAQLIKTSNGFHLWSETYDRALMDVLALQDEIAGKVVNSLQVILSPDSKNALAHAVSVDPAAYDYYLRGRAYMRTPPDESNREFALELFDKAIAADRSFADAYAGKCDALLGLYSYNLDERNFKSAEAACHRALTLDRRAAAVYIALGNLYRSSGQYDQAIAEYNTAIAFKSTAADAHVGLAKTYEKKNQPALAEQHYGTAIQLQPNYWYAQLSMGNFLFASNRVDEAIAYFTRISDLMPQSDTAFNNLGAAHFMSGDFEQASEAWQRSLEMNPTSIAYSNVAASLFFLERYEEALPLYHKALEYAPDSYEIWGNLADTYRLSLSGADMAAPMYNNAIALAHKRLDVNPSDADTHALVGHYYANLDNRGQALEHINQALRLAPENMYTAYNAATAYVALGDMDRATSLLGQALESGYPWHIMLADANLRELRNMPQFEALNPRQD